MDIERELKILLDKSKNRYIIKFMLLPIIYRRLIRRIFNKSKNFLARFEFYSSLAFLLFRENLRNIFAKAISFFDVAFLF